MYGKITAAAGLLISVLLFSGPAIPAPDKAEREAIERLQSEVVVLERQIRDLQESIDRTNGQTTTLISQVNDSVSTATKEISKIQATLADTQVKVTAGLSNVDSRFLAVDSGLRSINERLGKTLDQVTSLRAALADAKSAVPTIDPTDPVQLFSAAYGDFLKGNYPLAIDQFRQYLNRFPNLESSDDAQYWISESLENMGKPEEALSEYEQLISRFPRGDRVMAARLKRGLILIQLNQTDSGVAQLREIIESHPDAPEAASARQRLEQMGVPVKTAKEKPGASRTRKRTTKP